jgi:hypothetical protein
VRAVAHPGSRRDRAEPSERVAQAAASIESRSSRPQSALVRQHPANLLTRTPIAPLMIDRAAPPLAGASFSRLIAAPAPAEHLSLLGVIEAPAREIRMAVISVDGGIVRGCVGDIVGGRYRIDAFSEHRAELTDIATNDVLAVVPAPKPEIRPAAPAKAVPPGALRVVGEPAVAEIYVDGDYVGTVGDLSEATDGLPLEPGSHDVDLQAATYQPVRVAVRISPNRTTTYRVALSKDR